MLKYFIILLFLVSSNAYTEENQKMEFSQNELVADQNIIDDNIPDNMFDNMPTPDYQHSLIKMLITLVIIVTLLFITFWMFRRISKSRSITINSSSGIKILEKRALSPKSMLYLVEVNNEKVLISESHLEVRPIQALELDKPNNMQ
jgi:flagellar biogenesis protein FliO